MTLNIATLLRSSTARNPVKHAIAIGDVEIDYQTLHDLVQRFAGALASLGIKRGQHVALMMPNVPPFSVVYFGCHYTGCPVVPIHVLLTPDEIAYHLEDSDAVALVVWEGMLDQARAAFDRVAQCKHLIVAKQDPTDMSAPPGASNYRALLAAAEPMSDVAPTMPDDTAVILYTSGTTGRPKGAELTHFNMFYNAEYSASKLLRMSDDTVSLAVLPLFHSFGQTVLHNATLMAGGTLVLLPRFDPESVFKLIEKHEVTLFAGVPTMYMGLLHFPRAADYALSSLRYCVSGGSPMPVEVMRAFDEKYNVNILEGYGLSETSPVASFNLLNRVKKPGTVGVPISDVEFRLEDEKGNIVSAAGERGEICIKGHNVMKGYYKKPEATTEVLKDGWFHTGDIGTCDEEGYYAIVDRKKDMIIRGGYNVYPREVEETLYAYPGIAEAAVVGIPHETHGEEVKAIVAMKADAKATQEEIIAYCKEHLAAYKYPRVVEFRDTLPKGPTGKILKRELR